MAEGNSETSKRPERSMVRRRRNPRVTTRTGDTGYTDLLGEKDVPKYDDRVEVLGTLDEANSALGVARAMTRHQRLKQIVYDLQSNLYLVMAEIATVDRLLPNQPTVSDEQIGSVEELMEEIKNQIELPHGFITPGATPVGAMLDVARGVVRRAERLTAYLTHHGAIPNPRVLVFLNRASDFLFVLARYEEFLEGRIPDRPRRRGHQPHPGQEMLFAEEELATLQAMGRQRSQM
ncbi:MAG: cob(I)yrinic acid a,c-diamide adenosyltransferase [Chloroflexi bacterium]|nr:cob(I)yrinic acid a,c-diamide adenosyltransferase [Chloroflexota bacterium]MCL5947462.1 cob(I)yrinic acid a,c-diamide adenosyltransferase [Chloroflexota bacterium]